MPRRREPRLLTIASLRWVVRNRAYTRWHLVRYWRFLRFKLTHPHVVTHGIVFLDRDVEVRVTRGLGRLILGRWVHLGRGSAIRCHEGTLRIGDKCILGAHVSVNCYLDVELGDCVLIADDVYVSDFDHHYADPVVPIKDQGIVKSRVRIGDDVWLGTKATVVRGVAVGDHAVIGANAVVTRDIPAYGVAVGSPARVVRDRRTRVPAVDDQPAG